jgi:hypothetical protein
MRKDRELVLTVLLVLALALLAITTFALARAQQRIRLNFFNVIATTRVETRTAHTYTARPVLESFNPTDAKST